MAYNLQKVIPFAPRPNRLSKDNDFVGVTSGAYNRLMALLSEPDRRARGSFHLAKYIIKQFIEGLIIKLAECIWPDRKVSPRLSMALNPGLG